MRIIAGEFRGRQILAPESDTTRPITDRVKQSLFDILTPRIEDARVYDCFCGTGSMGLECLSRGARHATFFDADRSALLRLQKNIDTLKVADRSTIHRGDLFKWFDRHRAAPPEPGKIDLVFLDPPYRFLRELPQKLQQLAADLLPHLHANALVIFRHDAADRLDLPALQRADERSYGGMTLEFLRPPAGISGQ
jgi:16S rRNA (guanine966-N2)-methyltransferase